MTKTRYVLIAALAAVPFLMPTQAEAGRNNNRYCREYTKTVRIGGEMQSAYGTACMQPDGSWEMVSFNGHEDLFDDVERNTSRGKGRLVRVERRPVDYYYPIYERPYYRTYYRQPANVFTFYWSDNDGRRRDWRRDRDNDRGRDRHHNRRGHHRDRDRD
jgi:hypothetical protein